MIFSKLPKTKQSSLSLTAFFKTGFSPTLNHYNNFIDFLFKSQRFQLITHFTSQLKSNQIEGDYFTHSFITRALLKQRKYEKAVEFVNTQIGRTLITPQNRILDSIIQGFCIVQQDPERGFSVLQDWLKIDGIVPSSRTFCALISCFSRQGKMDRAIEVLEVMANEKFKCPFDNFVVSSVIYGFVNIGEPELAVGFLENFVKSAALELNIVTYTCILSAYCRLGSFEELFDLVSSIESNGLAFDGVFYGNLVYEYFREGNVLEALQKHKEMVDRKIELDMISYTILIDGFSKEGHVEKAVGFLYRMRKDQIKLNLITYTAIMLGFCKKGKLEEALMVFKMSEDLGIEMDEFAYATLIDGMCKRRDFDGAFRFLDDMEEKGIHPSVTTYNIIINGLCKAQRTSEGYEVSRGIVGDVFTYSTLLHGYIEEHDTMGMLMTKKQLEESGFSMDIVMCNVLIKALFMVGSFEDALVIYKGMLEMGLAPNDVTYCTLIGEYCKFDQTDEALEIFDEFRRSSIVSVACYNCIINGLCKKGMVDMATQVYVELNERGLPLDTRICRMLFKSIVREQGPEGISYFISKIKKLEQATFGIICNDALSFICDGGFSEFACDVYTIMRKNGSFFTISSYHLLLELLLEDGKMRLTKNNMSDFVKFGIFEPRIHEVTLYNLCMNEVTLAIKFLKAKSFNSFPTFILEKLTKNGRAGDAFKLIMGAKENLPLMDVVDYTIVVDGLSKGGHIEKALELCILATKNGITLNIITYNSIMNGLCHQGCLVEAFRLFDSLEKIDLTPSEVTYSTLIDTLSKEGYFLDAKKLFEKMIFKGLKPNIRVHNSLINGYCKFARLQEVLKLIADLYKKGIKGDEFTVSAVIKSFCRNGDMEGALEYYFDSKGKDLLPDLLGFIYLIKGLCSKGRMEESRSILMEMLQTESILKLLNEVDAGAKMESVSHFLVSMCDQGSIHEAIIILDEVASMFFPIVKRVNEKKFGLGESEPLISCHEGNDDDVVHEMSKSNDFDSYYGVLNSLCSRGELRKANKFAKLFARFQGG